MTAVAILVVTHGGWVTVPLDCFSAECKLPLLRIRIKCKLLHTNEAIHTESVCQTQKQNQIQRCNNSAPTPCVMVKGREELIPHFFNFLGLLCYVTQSSKTWWPQAWLAIVYWCHQDSCSHTRVLRICVGCQPIA